MSCAVTTHVRPMIEEGYPFAFSVLVTGLVGVGAPGIPENYTQAVFQVRERADPSLPLILGATHATGVTIAHDSGIISVSIGATRTVNLQVTDKGKAVHGELRLIDPLNADDTIGGSLSVWLKPTGIGAGG
jgi:hypothetical protein